MQRNLFLRTRTLLLLTALFAVVVPAQAQQFSLGADIMSRYVWRGTDYGESASIQPALTYTHGAFSIGSWASYAVDPSAGLVNEHDLWLSFAAGPVSFGVTDYYFPNAGVGFFELEDGGGAHSIEPFVSFSGPETLPISLYAGMFVYNDPDNSIFLSAAYPFAVDGVDLSVRASASGGESALYGTDTFGIVEMSLTAGRSVPITETFSLPVKVAYILNPYAERSYLVFGITL